MKNICNFSSFNPYISLNCFIITYADKKLIETTSECFSVNIKNKSIHGF